MDVKPIIVIAAIVVAVLPIVFRDRIHRLVYVCLSVGAVTMLIQEFKWIQPNESVWQFLLYLVVMCLAVAIYTKHYFLKPWKKQEI